MLSDLHDVVRWIIGVLATTAITVIGWLGQRAISRIDDDMKSMDRRISDLESLKADIMLRPDILALDADQRKEMREKYKEQRQDYKELRAEISNKLDYVINRLDHRQKNERAEDDTDEEN